MELLTGIGIGVAVVLAVVALYAWMVWRSIKSRVDKLIEEVLAEAEANMVGLDIEVDKNMYFCYNNEDKTFVCQGTTVDEIKQAFQARYPDKIAYLAGGDPDVVEYFKTELTKLTVNENSTGQ
jgi:hypothetical protein